MVLGSGYVFIRAAKNQGTDSSIPIQISSEETYQIAAQGVHGLRIEIVTDAPPPPALVHSLKEVIPS